MAWRGLAWVAMRGSRVQITVRRAGGFTMAALARAVDFWLAGREAEAFAVLREAPESLWDIISWPDDRFPPVLMRSPYGDAWLVRFPEDLTERTALPVLSLPVLREFAKAYRKEGRG